MHDDGEDGDNERLVDVRISSVDYRIRLRSSMGSVIMQEVPDSALRFDVPIDRNNVTSAPAAHIVTNPTTGGKIPGILYLLIALTIFSCQSSVFVYLNGLNPDVYTACNVLCSSSIFGVFFMSIYLFVYKRSVSWEDVKGMSNVDLLALFVGSTLYSVVGPYLFYIGLLSIDVPMASIVQRLESLNFLVLSYFALNTTISYITLISAVLTLSGVVVAVLFNALFTDDKVEFPIGYLYILLSGYATSFSLLLSKKYLAKCNTGLIALSRTTLGAIMFYALSHIINVSSSQFASMELWKYAMPYGFIYIFVGQVAWVTALAVNPPVVLSVGINILFCLNLVWSGILLNVYPTKESWVGSGFIFASIAVAIYESVHYHKEQKEDVSTRLKRELSSSNEKKSSFHGVFKFIGATTSAIIGQRDVNTDTAYGKVDATGTSYVDGAKGRDVDKRGNSNRGNVIDGANSDSDLETNLI